MRNIFCSHTPHRHNTRLRNTTASHGRGPSRHFSKRSFCPGAHRALCALKGKVKCATPDLSVHVAAGSTHPPLTVGDTSNTHSARLFLILAQLFTYIKNNKIHIIKKKVAIQRHKFTVKKDNVSAAFLAHSCNCSATFKKYSKKGFALSATGSFEAEHSSNTPQCKMNAFSFHLRKEKKGGNPLTCAQSLRWEVSPQLEHPQELASSLLPDSRKVSLPVTVLQSVRVLSLLSYFSIHQVSRAFSLPLLPSLLCSELM